ncbi:MAG TPA: FAD-binding oxidoreductase [Steroidobacteraceae bacterium]|nr:FAD-binding oxidoreductase [Steroidobacteraceae bacterium]
MSAPESNDPASSNYYYATTRPPPAHAPLAGDVRADVCIVGGGISGLSAALHLAERGYAVALLEAEFLGFGGSGRSGGQTIFGYASGQEKLKKIVGAVDARRMWDISLEGMALLRDLIAKHRIDCDYVAGHLHVGVKPRHDAELAAECETLHDEYGYRSVRSVPHDELRTLVASARYTTGLYDSASGHLNPYKYTLGLGAAATRAGVRIFEHSPVTKLEIAKDANGEHVAHAANGSVRARHLLIAGNALLGNLVPELARKLMAVGTYIATTGVLGESRAAALITNNAAVADINWVLDYFRRSADHRLLFGGRVSYSGVDPFDSARVLRGRIQRVFPQLADTKIEYAWGGFVDITPNRAPHFGRLAPNAYFLQGFSGHGMVLTGIAGKLVAEAIAGTAERFDVFARIPHHDFPGGALFRRPALVLAMLWFRLKDLL